MDQDRRAVRRPRRVAVLPITSHPLVRRLREVVGRRATFPGLVQNRGEYGRAARSQPNRGRAGRPLWAISVMWARTSMARATHWSLLWYS